LVLAVAVFAGVAVVHLDCDGGVGCLCCCHVSI
jgi:hypothetical protein